MTNASKSPTAELTWREAVKAIRLELKMSDDTADWVLWEMTSFPFGSKDEVMRMARECVEKMHS